MKIGILGSALGIDTSRRKGSRTGKRERGWAKWEPSEDPAGCARRLMNRDGPSESS